MDRLKWVLILLAVAVLIVSGFLMAWDPCPPWGGNASGWGWC